MRMVKVKIPVAVDAQGRWYAYGWNNGSASGPNNHDELLEVTDLDQVGPNEKLYWLHAELMVPEIEHKIAEVTMERTNSPNQSSPERSEK